MKKNRKPPVQRQQEIIQCESHIHLEQFHLQLMGTLTTELAQIDLIEKS